MYNFVCQGNNANFVNNGETTLKAGDPFFLGSICAIANLDVAPNEMGSAAIAGVYTLAKAATKAIAQGAKLYLDATAKTVSDSGGAGDFFGFAYDPSPDGQKYVNCLLSR